jgi:hypothetical protein
MYNYLKESFIVVDRAIHKAAEIVLPYD